MRLPKDLWDIVLKFKKDMELFERNESTHWCLGLELPLPGYSQYLKTYNFPFRILYDYIESRAIYRERLAVWGLRGTDLVDPLPDDGNFPLLL